MRQLLVPLTLLAAVSSGQWLETTIWLPDSLCGLTAPGHLTVEHIGSLETKDATRTRIKWYCSLALFSAIKAAALSGVKD